MSDMTKCINETCPLRENCARFRMNNLEGRQIYCYYKPDKNGNCHNFVKFEEEKIDDLRNIEL